MDGNLAMNSHFKLDYYIMLEGNKLIAEFMGYHFKKNIERYAGTFYYKGKKRFVQPESLQYHSSWDWLMPVVEKIESIVDSYHGHFGVHISSNNCTIQATNFRSDKIKEPPMFFADHYGATKIEATWLAVVFFIKWYNTHNEKQ